MSDGDNATPGRHSARPTSTAPTSGLPEIRGHRQPPRRGSARPSREPDADRRPPRETGNHTDGDHASPTSSPRSPATSPRPADRQPHPSPGDARAQPPTAPSATATSPAASPPAPRTADRSRSGHRGHPRRCPTPPSCPDLAALRQARAERAAPERIGEAPERTRRAAEAAARRRAMVVGRARGRADRRARAGADRRRLAVAVRRRTTASTRSPRSTPTHATSSTPTHSSATRTS